MIEQAGKQTLFDDEQTEYRGRIYRAVVGFVGSKGKGKRARCKGTQATQGLRRQGESIGGDDRPRGDMPCQSLPFSAFQIGSVARSFFQGF